MNYLWAFLIGGAICAVGQLFIDLTKLTRHASSPAMWWREWYSRRRGCMRRWQSLPVRGERAPCWVFGHLLAKGVRTAAGGKEVPSAS